MARGFASLVPSFTALAMDGPVVTTDEVSALQCWAGIPCANFGTPPAPSIRVTSHLFLCVVASQVQQHVRTLSPGVVVGATGRAWFLLRINPRGETAEMLWPVGVINVLEPRIPKKCLVRFHCVGTAFSVLATPHGGCTE